MKRACIAVGIVVALVASLGGPASAGERRRTRTVQYTGWNEWHFFAGGASGPSGPAVFGPPSWARSVRVLVRDDTGLPVAYKLRFNQPKGANTGPAHGCGGSARTFDLPRGTKRLFVQTEAPPFGCGLAGVPTTGTISVTFSSRRTASTALAHAEARRIVFTSNRTGTSQLWSMNVDGSDQRRIVFSTQDDIMPDVSSDGKRLLFARGTGYSTSNQAGSIWVADADGSRPHVVAPPPEGGTNYKPAWSPDGKQIAFVRAGQDRLVQDIWVMNEDGSGQRPLTTDGALNVWPSWSPDGRQIAFGKGLSQIWVMDADGSNAHLINANGNLRYTVTWGPTNRIVYTDTLPGTTNRQIRTMDPDGSNIETLSAPLDDDRFPSWSPDGERIAFSKGRQPCAGTNQREPVACGFEIWTMAADGSDQTKIAGTEVLETDLGEGYPVYVPHASARRRGP